MFPTRNGLDIIERIVGARLWGASRMAVIEVGVSGGIDRRWSVFGERLAAVAFDSLTGEVERLNSVETRIDVRYEAARVGCRGYENLFPPDLRTHGSGTSGSQPPGRFITAAREDSTVEAGASVRHARRSITLDEYLAGSRLRPNALKVATKGDAFEVLLGASGLLSSPDCLAVQIDAPFHGPVHDYASVFSNLDRCARQHGFSLFLLQPHSYSRAALPAPFLSRASGRTASGQAQCADVVYFRDLAHPARQQAGGATPEQALKLCCLFALYGLDDCAAELLASPLLAGLDVREQLLDAATPPMFGAMTYRDFMARFAIAPEDWQPENVPAASRTEASASDRISFGNPMEQMSSASWAIQAAMAKNQQLLSRIHELRERAAGLKDIQRKLRHRLDDRNAKIKRLQDERLRQKARIP